MKYQLAQLNIAHFELPRDHPKNADFINALDHVNAVAEAQPGFIWRFTDDGNDAIDVRAFDDPNMIVNMSVWTDMDALSAFVYRNEEHLAIMRRRREWFKKIRTHMVLWWIEEGHIPTLDEAKHKLALLEENGPSPKAFTFKEPFPPHGEDSIDAVLDDCA